MTFSESNSISWERITVPSTPPVPLCECWMKWIQLGDGGSNHKCVIELQWRRLSTISPKGVDQSSPACWSQRLVAVGWDPGGDFSAGGGVKSDVFLRPDPISHYCLLSSQQEARCDERLLEGWWTDGGWRVNTGCERQENKPGGVFIFYFVKPTTSELFSCEFSRWASVPTHQTSLSLWVPCFVKDSVADEGTWFTISV